MDFDDEEDELQMMLEGREAGDDKLVESVSNKSGKSTFKSLTKSPVNRRKVVSESESEDDDEEEEEEEEEDKEVHQNVLNQRQLSNDGFGDEAMQSNEDGLDDEEEDDGTPKFDEAIEMPQNRSKAKEGTDGSAKIKVVRNPRVILSEEVLKQVDGIVALPPLFRNLKFKGKTHEKEDLNLIMSVYERWAHRLMPSLQFDDFVEKAETLTRKAKMKTFLTKIRNNMSLDVRGGNADLVPEDAMQDVPSEGEDFQPISYFPEKEDSFSDDEEFLAGILDDDPLLTQTKPDKLPGLERDDNNSRAMIDLKNSNQNAVDQAEKDVPNVDSDNAVVKAKKRRMVIVDSDEENSQPLLSSMSHSDEESNQSNKRKRLESGGEENSRDSLKSAGATEMDEEDEDEGDRIQMKKKRRKLMVIDDENEESGESIPLEQETNDKVAVDLNEFVETKQTEEAAKDQTLNDEKELTEEEFLALMEE